MTETGIENEPGYRAIKRVESGVSLLIWLAVYAAAVIVVLFDLMVWRPN